MGISTFPASGAGTVDKVLGNAYQIVKHVQENLVNISAVAGMTDQMQILVDNLQAAEGAILASHTAIILAGVANYRATFAEALTDFVVGDYFTSAESGSLRLYQRVVAAPGYVDQGDVVAPVSKTLLAGSGGLALLGTSEEGVNAQQAMNARVKATALALGTAAASLGAKDPTGADSNVQAELDLRVSSETLALLTAAAAIGTQAPSGANVTAALSGLVPVFATTVELETQTHAVNTTGKFKGKAAWNTTSNMLFIAEDGTPQAVWRSADGTSQAIPV